MSKLIAYSLILLAVISCQSLEKAPIPDTFLDEDRMVEILTDIAFVRAGKTTNKKIFENESINPEEYILKKHGIDSTVFAQNNAWYSDNLDTYAAIFTRVKANLNKDKVYFERLKEKEDSLETIRDSIKKVDDSIKKAKGSLSDKDPLVKETLRTEETLQRISDSLALLEEETVREMPNIKQRKELLQRRNRDKTTEEKETKDKETNRNDKEK